MPSLASSSRSSRSLFRRSSASHEELLKEYNVKEYPVSKFESIVLDSPATNESSHLLGLTQMNFPDMELAFRDFIIGDLHHCKEARNHSKWEHEFLCTTIIHPNSSEAVAILLIDREQRPLPDIVRVIPGDIVHPDLNLLHILARLGYRPFNLGRSCAFASPPSVGEIASILAKKSQAGGEYTVHNHNCYWYAKEVFDHCLDTYGGSIINGPYCDDLGTFMKDTPEAFVAEVRVETFVQTTCIVAGIALEGLTTSSLLFGACVVAASTCAGLLTKRARLSQAKPLWYNDNRRAFTRAITALITDMLLSGDSDECEEWERQVNESAVTKGRRYSVS